MSRAPTRYRDNLAALFLKRGTKTGEDWVCTSFFTEAERQALLAATKVDKARAAGVSKDRTQALDAVLRGIQQRNPKLFREE